MSRTSRPRPPTRSLCSLSPLSPSLSGGEIRFQAKREKESKNPSPSSSLFEKTRGGGRGGRERVSLFPYDCDA
ncbi:hypothetical protein IE53DRAFT_391117 [Violaceomyces palustris]|uniref:Uncharacterized protein n=1 Tax=Violaceomyces palustris TaxID=1673888 RepID=A0ACD0NLN2_9BASI|nr:hypothetical protein IE53DRAFT_391117 [Violaceomyces palustris]